MFYNKKMYWIFGCVIYNKQRKERTCLNEIVIFDPYSKEMNVRNPYHVPERLLNPRKYMAGFFLHDTFFCHGGIDTRGKVLKSFIQINLDTMQWKDVKLLPHNKKGEE